jgi:hypothetical protein
MPRIPAYGIAALGAIGLLWPALSPAWGAGSGGQEGGGGLAVAPAAVSAQLYPGATGDVVFAVTNTNPVPVRVEAATLSGVTVTNGTGCSPSHFSSNSGDVTPVTIDAGETAPVTVPAGIRMDLDAPNACQGVTVTVRGTVFGSSI